MYLLELTAGQLLRLNIEAPADSTLLSLYLPESTEDNSAVFSDSEQTTWSGSIARSGFYELVVVNTSAKPIDYQLAASVDNVTISPPIAPDGEELPPILNEESDSDENFEENLSGENNTEAENDSENPEGENDSAQSSD